MSTTQKPLKERLENALATLRGFVVLSAEVDKPETDQAHGLVQREIAVVEQLAEELHGAYVLTREDIIWRDELIFHEYDEREQSEGTLEELRSRFSWWPE